MAKVVTITNPVTGQPAQVDQLDHTAQQIDDAVEAARWSHRNLLDNAYWASPDAIIDQRNGWVVPPNTPYYSDTGLTTQAGTVSAYTTASPGNGTYGTITVSGTTYYVVWSAAVRGYVGAGYTIDRLKMVVPGVLLIADNGINLKLGASTYGYSVFAMLIDGAKKLLGKTVTLSILTTNGLFSNSGVLGSNPGWNTQYASLSYVRSYFDGDLLVVEFIVVSDNDPDIIATKLELGSVQTLAHQDEDGVWQLNEIPDYVEQLARCQYYHREGYINAWLPRARDTESPKYSMTVNFPKMRTAPAVTLYDGGGNIVTSQPSVAVSFPESFTVVSDVETVLYKYVLNSDL